MIRYIYQYNNRKHICYDDFFTLMFLPVEKRIEFLSLCLMYKIFKSIAPSYLCNLVKSNSGHHQTRNTVNKYILPSVKSNGHLTFMFNAIKLCNGLTFLPPSTIPEFKKKCKTFLFNQILNEEQSDFLYY